MTLEQIRIFKTVAETLNMTRASELLHLTQPAISAAISNLEQRYDTLLFDRIGRRLELTEAGRLFLPEATAVLARASDAVRLFDDLEDLQRGEIHIAASQTLATYWLPQRMARFAASAPQVKLHLFAGNSSQAAARVHHGEADIGFVESLLDYAHLGSRTVGKDTIQIYASPNHPWASRRLTVKMLESATWVMRERGSGTRDHLDACLKDAGVSVAPSNIPLELPTNEAALEAVQGSDWITAVSELAAASRVKSGLIVPLKWTIPQRKFSALMHAGRKPSRALEAFLRSL